MIPQGSLIEFSLSDLLQIVSMEAATGTLELSAPGRSGAIEAVKGTIAAASCGPKLGDEAVYALFLWESGEFNWRPEAVGQLAGRVELPLGDLSREGIHRRDLWRVARESLPSLDAVFGRKSGIKPGSDWSAESLAAWQALEGGLTIGDLGRKLGVSPAMAAQALIIPWQGGALAAEFPPAELSWLLFKQILADMGSRFSDISGLKMTDALAAYLVERGQAAGLDVQLKAGKVACGDRPQDDPTEACRAYLAEISAYVSRLHGAELIDRLYSDHLRTAQASERQALERLGVAVDAERLRLSQSAAPLQSAAGQAAGD